MESIYENIKSYLSYLNNQLKLDTSIHFNDRVISLVPKEMWAGLSVYNCHSNLYCTTIKKTSMDKCICEQKNMYNKHYGNGAFFKVCYAGVYEYISPISVNGATAGFVSVSGFRSDSCYTDINRALWERSLLSQKEFPEKLCETVIPPLCIMLKCFLELCRNNDKNEYNAIIQYLNEYYTNITLEDLCRHFSRSRSYLSHMFKKTFGKSFSDYCNELKLNNAKRMLRETEISVTDIAFDCGFGDVSYFINIFKRKNGITPLQYRKKQNKNNT